MVEEVEGFKHRAEEKQQAYSGVLEYLKHELADYSGRFQPVVMGVRVSTREGKFKGQLELL